MAKEKSPPESTGDVPVWFMTYSDVITLLMTFFILLMTFATDEPEKFEKMQIATFGGSGATGVAGPTAAMEADAVLARQRPRSARTSMRGSETASITEEPGMTALSKGLEGLDGPQDFDPHRSYTIEMQMSDLFDSSNRLTSEGKQHLYTAAMRVRGADIRATVRAAPEELDRCLQLNDFMIEAGGLLPAMVGVGAWLGPEAKGKVRLELQQMGRERS